MIGASCSAFAGDNLQSIDEIDKQITDIQNKIDVAQKEVTNTNLMLKKNEQEISAILQNENDPQSSTNMTELAECEKNLLEKEGQLNSLRDDLDKTTAEIISLEGAESNELKLKKDDIESQYNAMQAQINELNSKLEKLRLGQNQTSSYETKLKNLLEEQSKYDDCIKKNNDIIKNLQIQIDKLKSDKLKIENKIKNYSKNLNDWNKYLSGNQFEDNMLDGERFGNACWLFSATNVLNYFSCIIENKAPIKGFQNVVNLYFQKCGKRELIGDVEYIIEYLSKFRISTYSLSFQNAVKNPSNIPAEKKEQTDNIKEFIVEYFKKSKCPAPILNLNIEHWLTFAAYNEIEDTLLVVDSATGTAEWKSTDSVINSAANVYDNQIIWQLLFSSKNSISDSICFSEDWGMPLTNEAKKDILDKICTF